MTRVCDDVKAALGFLDVCIETEDGARVATHCMYPSFDPVNVFVSKWGEGYRVHDGGGAFRSAWTHGRDDLLTLRMVNRQAQRYRLSVSDGSLLAEVPSLDFLASAVLAVANASASAAHAAVEKIVAVAEQDLVERIEQTLKRSAVGEFRKEVEIVGKSGKLYQFDFAVAANDNTVLIEAVSPHHVSISSKYVAFSDAAEKASSLAVFDKPLANDDIALIQQVASLVRVNTLERSLKVALRYGT